MHYVVGSGPSGVACAQALLEKGLSVCMIDAGIQLESERSSIVAKLGASKPEAWDPNLVACLKEGMASGSEGIPLKRIYGSDYPYREIDTHVPCTLDGIGLKPSLAQGGLSTVWGAAMMPYLDCDLHNWPLDCARLGPHYAAALKLSGVSARKDALAELFPLYTEDPVALEPSRQIRALLGSAERNKSALKKAGVHCGASRIAVRVATPKQAGCVYCGLCMYGCPYSYIYNSAFTVPELQKNPCFTYRPDTVATLLDESEAGVTITARDRTTGKELKIEAERVYLAAGVIATTKLLLESRQQFDQKLTIKDSQYFLLPMLLPFGAPGVEKEALHTLSQAFIEIQDPKVNANTVHLQIYSYSDLIGQAIRATFGKFGLKFEFLARQMEQRLLIVQGFMHSDVSSKIATTLKRTAPGERSYLEMKPEINPQARRSVSKVIAKLLGNTLNLGALPLPPMLQFAEPGRSFHCGGTFPMRATPGPFESDILGRPHGWNRVHAVDTTVFPTIPATTITFSVMANAHRIGWESADLR